MELSYKKETRKVSLVSIIGNIILSGLKLLAGFVAKSSAMVSDAVHSASVLLSLLALNYQLRNPIRNILMAMREWSV